MSDKLTVKQYADSGAENSRIVTSRLVDRAFEGRKGHGGTPYVVHRQMRPKELRELLMIAYASGWRDGVDTLATGVRMNLVEDLK